MDKIVMKIKNFVFRDQNNLFLNIISMTNK